MALQEKTLTQPGGGFLLVVIGHTRTGGSAEPVWEIIKVGGREATVPYVPSSSKYLHSYVCKSIVVII